MIVNNALHRLGISPRPPGVASFPQMIAVLDDDVPPHDPDEFYGFAIKQRTAIDGGTPYPLLKRMNKAGWLTSRPEDEQSWLAAAPPGRGPGRRRTYYTLTTEGRRAALHELDRHPSRLDPEKTKNR
jgi:hypothetical protein